MLSFWLSLPRNKTTYKENLKTNIIWSEKMISLHPIIKIFKNVSEMEPKNKNNSNRLLQKWTVK